MTMDLLRLCDMSNWKTWCDALKGFVVALILAVAFLSFVVMAAAVLYATLTVGWPHV